MVAKRISFSYLQFPLASRKRYKINDESQYLSSTTSKKNERNIQKSVRFDEKIQTLETEYISKKERKKLWYQEDHYRQEVKEAAMNFALGRERSNVPRGLEHWISPDSDIRKKIIKVSVKSVLEEQFRQYYMRCKNPKLLAMVYVQYSAQSQIRAHKVGLQDQKDVKNYLSE